MSTGMAAGKGLSSVADLYKVDQENIGRNTRKKRLGPDLYTLE